VNANEASGQFSSSTEGLYGRDYDLVNAGYKPMPEAVPEKPAEFADAKEAAEELIAERPPAEPDEHTIYYDLAATSLPIRRKPSRSNEPFDIGSLARSHHKVASDETERATDAMASGARRRPSRCQKAGGPGMMDRDAVGLAVHDISMMVQVLLNAIETMQGNEETPRAFEMPYSEGEMLSFVAFDLEKRVKALRDGLEGAASATD
jgi:hypothetical protein